MPDELVDDALSALHAGPCPDCGGPGPVDVHTAHSAWSALVMTSWKSTPRVSCRPCATRAKLKAIAFTGAFGWWGFPWGLIASPVQIGRNVLEMMNGPRPDAPSAALEDIARRTVAAQALATGEVRPPRVQFRRAERAAEQQQPGERPG